MVFQTFDRANSGGSARIDGVFGFFGPLGGEKRFLS